MTGHHWLLLAMVLLGACRSSPAPATPCDCENAGERGAVTQTGRDRPGVVTGEDAAALERIIGARRSVRLYTPEPLELEDVMALLWAAQGVTLPPEEAGRVDGQGLRAAPSAGATFPLETYLLVNRVEGLELGLYHYRPEQDSVEPTGRVGYLARDVAEAALRQRVVATAAAVLIFASVNERTAQRYGDRAERYVNMELGHAAENAHLMATARGLGACAIGAFDEAQLARALELPDDHVPYYMLTVGRPQVPGE